MTVECSRPWPDACVDELIVLVCFYPRELVSAWVVEHVGVDPEAWDDFAITLAGISSVALRNVADAQLAALGVRRRRDDLVFAPEVGEDADPTERDAGLMVTMSANDDEPGVRGVLAAVRERADVQSLCGSLSAIARSALRSEAMHALLAARGGVS